jgi:hypothetical protein
MAGSAAVPSAREMAKILEGFGSILRFARDTAELQPSVRTFTKEYEWKNSDKLTGGRGAREHQANVRRRAKGKEALCAPQDDPARATA